MNKFWFTFLLYTLLAVNSYSQALSFTSKLADHGFENVSSAGVGEDLYITYENNLYRFEAKGLSEVISHLLSSNNELSNFKRVHFVLRSQNLPMAIASIELSDLSDYSNSLIDKNDLAARIFFSIDVGNVDELFEERNRINSSFYKIDIPVGLKFDYLLGDFNDGFQSRTYVNSRVLTTFGTGMEFEFDFLNIVQNDIPGRAISSPTILKVSQGFRLDDNRFLTASIGYLPQGKFGLHAKYRNYLAQERFYIELIYGVTRTGYLDQNWVIQNNRNSDAIYQAIFNYRWNKYDTDFNLTYGTFAYADLGYKFQIQRQFNEVYFNLFYSRTDLKSAGSFNSEEPAIIGFSLTVPFGQSKYMKPGRIRVRTEDQFYLLYRYSGFSVSGFDIMHGTDIFSDIREFYPEVLRKGLIKHIRS